MKTLHEFEVEKKFIEKVEEKTKKGVLIKDVERSELKKVLLKYPGRREVDMMRVIQSAEFGKAIGMGIQTKESMRASILDNGGFKYAKVDLDEANKILPAIQEKRNQAIKNRIEGADSTELDEEVLSLEEKIIQMENRLTQVYEHSAETIAEQNTVIWAVVNLTFWEDETPLFPGVTEEAKMESYYKFWDEPESSEAERAAFSTAYLIFMAYLFKGLSVEEIKERLKVG